MGNKGHNEEEEGQHEGDFELWSAWSDQFEEAILPGFDKEEGGLWTGMALHYISSTFKVRGSEAEPSKPQLTLTVPHHVPVDCRLHAPAGLSRGIPHATRCR